MAAHENFIDGDPAVVVHVTRETGIDARVPEGAVHHGEDLIHGHGAVSVAIAGARRRPA
jgi:hypothetical protein